MATVTSRFAKKANRLIVLALSIHIAFVITFYYFFIGDNSGSLFIVSGVLLLALGVFMLLIHRELYFKMLIVKIDDREIVLTRYAGYFFTHKFFWSEVDSYEIRVEESESYDLSEVVKLKANGKTIAIISEFYYQNYNELKSTVITLMKQKKKR